MNIFKKALSVFFSVLLVCACIPTAVFAASNEQTVYEYLKNHMTEMNSAAICGMMAGIKCESNFNPKAQYTESDGSLSYGICQWNKGRLDSFRSFCSSRNLDSSTLYSQLAYLEYELKQTSEKNAYQLICSVADNQNGAYKAGYYCAKYFERCASQYYEMRAELSRDTYWPIYGTSTPEPDTDYSTIECGTCSFYIKNAATGKYLSVDTESDTNKVNISVSDVSDNGRFRFVMNEEDEGYCMKPEFTTETVLNIYGNVVKAGCNVCLWKRSGDTSQHFNFEKSGDSFIIRNVQNRTCVLDVSGTNVQVSAYSSASNSQKWVLIPDKSPEKPVVAVNATTDSEQVTVGWNAVKYADKYSVSLTNLATGQVTTLANSTTANETVTSLAAGNYSVTVTALNTLLPFGFEAKGKTSSDAYSFTVTASHVHSFTGRTEVIKQATCTEEGILRTYCSDEKCGEFIESSINAVGHSYDGVSETVREASCTEYGLMRIYCSNAGCESYVEFDTNPTGHSFNGINERILEPTCTESGTLRTHCANPGCNEYEDSEIEPKGHDYAVFEIERSYTSKGCTRYLCKACSYYYDEDEVDPIPVYYGDANGDGAVTLKDLLLTRKHVAGVDAGAEFDILRADANADGSVTLRDVLLIRQFVAGVLAVFPPDITN